MAPDLDLAHLRQWVGRSRQAEDDMRLFPALALAAALDNTSMPGIGDPLPPAWHWLYFLETPRAAATGTDGHSRLGEFLPPVPLPRRMWAAGCFELLHPLRVGYAAKRTSTIQSVDAKSGRSGSLIFVTVEHVVTQDQQLCIREQQNLVYRDIPAAPEPASSGEAASTEPDWTRTVEPDPVLLFRYSALTYNSHRIHYDQAYVREHELYPALVVHGPLLTTLLLDLLREEIPHAPVSTCRFRAHRPTFNTSPFAVRGKRDGNTVRLWSTDSDGFVGMSALVTLT